MIDDTTISAAISEIITTIPSLQWCRTRLRYGVGFTDIADNPEVLLLVIANELHRRETGRDDWERFEAMSPADLTTYLNEHLPAHPDDDPKGDAAG